MDLQADGGTVKRAAIIAMAAVGLLTFILIAVPSRWSPLSRPSSVRVGGGPSRGVAKEHGFSRDEPPPVRSISDKRFSPLDGQALSARVGVGEAGFVVGFGSSNWCDVFEFPDAASVRRAQALVGDTVRVRQYRGTWSEVAAGDAVAWSGWMSDQCVARGQENFRREIASGPWLIVVAAPVLRTTAGDLPFGALLPDISKPGEPRVRLPDGRIISVGADAVRPRGAVSVDEALKRVRQFLRAPYQQGANTVEAMDAAGLVQLVFRVVGRTLPRDINALQRAGENVPWDQVRAGDVIFFSTFDKTQPHAVILLDAGKTFLEASPASGVNVGLLEQMRNRSVLALRRYVVDGHPLRLIGAGHETRGGFVCHVCDEKASLMGIGVHGTYYGDPGLAAFMTVEHFRCRFGGFL